MKRIKPHQTETPKTISKQETNWSRNDAKKTERLKVVVKSVALIPLALLGVIAEPLCSTKPFEWAVRECREEAWSLLCSKGCSSLVPLPEAKGYCTTSATAHCARSSLPSMGTSRRSSSGAACAAEKYVWNSSCRDCALGCFLLV